MLKKDYERYLSKTELASSADEVLDLIPSKVLEQSFNCLRINSGFFQK